MAQLPAAFSCHRWYWSRTFSPAYWTTKSTMLVVPPHAAARVPVSKVSLAKVPPKGISMWVCASMPPGMTYLPVASITVSTLPSTSKPSSREPGASTAAMVSPSMSTSAVAVPVAFTTVPPLIKVVLTKRSCLAQSLGNWSQTASKWWSKVRFLTSCAKGRWSRLGDRGVGVRTAVPVELPGVAHLPDHVEVEVADHEVLVLAAAHRADQVALRVHELAGPVEGDGELAVLVVLGADPVGRGDEVPVGRGGGRLLDLPQPVREARLRGVRVEDDLRAVQSQLAPTLREVPVVADVDTHLADRRVEDGVAEVAGAEVELLPELVEVRDVVLAVLAEDAAVRVHHHGGVVVDAGLLLLIDRQHHDHAELTRQRGEALHDGPVGRLGVVVVLDVLGDAEVGPVEELLEADDLSALRLGVPGEALVQVQHRGLVTRPGRLGDSCSDRAHVVPSFNVASGRRPRRPGGGPRQPVEALNFA